MKFLREDWKKIQRATLMFLIVMTSAIMLLIYEDGRKNTSKNALDQQKKLLVQATNQFVKSGEERASIQLNLPKYQALLNHGAIGEERRIEWIDALRNTHQDNKLFSIKFTIGVQSIYQPVFSQNIAPFQPHHSPMKIELALLHEHDLLVLLQGLKQRNLAPFIIQQCEMIRQNGNIGSSLTANLQAKCDLDWITLHEPITSSKNNKGT